MPPPTRITDIPRSTGFDYLRLSLSCTVFVSHIGLVSYGHIQVDDMLADPLLGSPLRLVLPMFFALSGFLVAGSLLRCRTLVSFVGLRVLRIVPALACEVTLSALILGLAFTHLDAVSYLRSAEFQRYFLNIVGDIHYTLPGVFTGNPYPDNVNVQLWTIPWELYCYIGLWAMALGGFALRRSAQRLILIGMQGVVCVYAVHRFLGTAPINTGASGPVLMLSFFTGLYLFIVKDEMRWSGRNFVLAAVLALLVAAVPFGNYFLAFPCAYATVFIGLRNPPRRFPIATGDYSYGIYLFGLPVQQAVAAMGPAFQHWYVSLLVGFPLTAACAAFSWHVVEKPMLRQKSTLLTLETAWLRWRAVVGSGRPVQPPETPLRR